MTDVQSGYLLLADISGYTAFLSESELGTPVIRRPIYSGCSSITARPPLVISKLEGDAVFSYTWGEEH